MKWHVYKKDDPNTWPQIDCPILIYGGIPFYRELLDTVDWNNASKNFVWQNERTLFFEECYYAYIGYVPSGYKTLYPTKCTCEDRQCEFEDDGYCMSDRTFACEYKRDVVEYLIEEKAIWKEFK